MKDQNRKPLTLSYQERIRKQGVDGRLVVGIMIGILATILWALVFGKVIW
jgi:hypothetical protein